METNEDYLNSILKSSLNDLENIENIDISKLSLEDALQDTQKLVNNAIRNKKLKENTPKQESKESNSTNCCCLFSIYKKTYGKKSKKIIKL